MHKRKKERKKDKTMVKKDVCWFYDMSNLVGLFETDLVTPFFKQL